MARGRRSEVHGVLVVDKPSGLTSHDVVARARRALGTRAVGHAGTLDPLATGVLVVAVGQATKLVPYLTADDKRYLAHIRLGAETSTLDADGDVTREAPVPALDRAGWQQLADGFVGVRWQQVPRVSAVRIAGQRAHAMARRGEDFEAPSRQVTAHAIEVLELSGQTLVVQVHCGKGYYVRALARDLTLAAGSAGHLTALRREASGQLTLSDATPHAEIEAAATSEPGALERRRLLARILPVEQACRRVLPTCVVDAAARDDVFHGRRIDPQRCDPVPDPGSTVALLSPEASALAVARVEGDGVRVVRGFRFEPG